MDPTSTTTYSLPPADQHDPLQPEFEPPNTRGCVDQQRMYERPSIWRQLWGIRNVLIVLLTPIILLPLPLAADDPKTQCAYVILVMAVFWITEAVPIAATSLIPIFLFPMMGLLSARTVSATYLNDTSVLFLGGLIVAVAIETWDLHKRIAVGVLMLVGAEPRWLMAGLMAVTWFLSMWISNTATTAMMIPIVQAVLQQLRASGHGEQEPSQLDAGEGNGSFQMEMTPTGDDAKTPVDDGTKVDVASNGMKVQPGGAAPDQHNRSRRTKADHEEEAKHLRMCKAMSLSICYAANVGGIASLTGTGPNLVLKGQSDIIFTDNNATSPITFSTWLVFGVPLSIIVLVILWIWMQIYFLRCRGLCGCFSGGANDDASKRVKAVIREEFRKLGPVSFAQWCIIIFFGILVVLWITRDFGEVPGWGKIFRPNFVSDSTPAIFISFLLFVCPANVPNVFCLRKSEDMTKPKIRPILRWQDVHEKMPWSLYLILGAGYSLARASQDSGLSEWLGGKLAVFSHLDPYLMLLILCYIVAFATEVTSNTAIATLMMPIMAQLAVNLNVNPLFFMFPTALATSFAFMLPVATPPNAIVFSYGQVRVIDMVTCGFLMNVVSVPVIILATATWGNAFFNFDTLPPGFLQLTTPSSVVNTSSPLALLLNGTG